MELLDTVTDYLLLPDQHLPLLSRFKKEIYLDIRLLEDQQHCIPISFVKESQFKFILISKR